MDFIAILINTGNMITVVLGENSAEAVICDTEIIGIFFG